jgi:glycosyltransferase involved in cell wall biosynthesis
MKVVITVEQRFDQTPDKTVWTPATFPYEFWQTYLDDFDQVQVVGRCRMVESVPANFRQVTGPAVEFARIPYYQGPWQFLGRAMSVARAARAAFETGDAVIMRVPSLLANCLEPALQQAKYPFGVTVVGDAYDVFAPQTVESPFRPLLRWWFTKAQKRQCATACGACYVTQTYLQQRYPNPTYQLGASDVEIENILSESRLYTKDVTGRIRLIMVGSLAQLYKAPDVLIRSTAHCIQEDGLDLELVLVGGGKYQPQLAGLADELGIATRVKFTGLIPTGRAVHEQLDKADVFILPSRTEGLPRAMLEAMARGLPCIGSTAGGIPELLSDENLVPPGDVEALAKKIKEVVTSSERMRAMSAANLAKARAYTKETLEHRQRQFYQHVRCTTEEWLKRQC